MSHKIIVARIARVEPIPNADKIQVAYVLGEPVVVSKEHQVGDIGLFFPVDLQLSEEFVRENNLSRRVENNKDKEKTGFFDENRRVRAQPFLKVKSCGLFMPLESVSFTGVIHSEKDEGLAFDELNGHKLVQKYVSEASKVKGQANQAKAVKKNFAPFFAKHVDSEQFKHYAERIQKGSLLHFQAKIHGTSARMGYLPVLKADTRPVWLQKATEVYAKFFGKEPAEPEYVYDYVLGTRNVVLKAHEKDKEGFHGSEAFRHEVFELVKPFLEKGQSIYGEIAGYANGKSIMPKHSIKDLKSKDFTKKYGEAITYSYGCKEHEYRFHIYRITMTTEAGTHIDWTQAQIDSWCADRGLLGPLEVAPATIYNGDVEALRQLVEELTERPALLTEDYIDPSHVSEGIIIRVDTGKLVPDFYKSKSFAFRAMEGQVEIEDPEDAA